MTEASHYLLTGALQKTIAADSPTHAAETPADAAPSPRASRSARRGRRIYAVLGCAKGDDAPVITKKYRKLALRYHPDRNRGDGQAEAAEKFRSVGRLRRPERSEQKAPVRPSRFYHDERLRTRTHSNQWT